MALNGSNGTADELNNCGANCNLVKCWKWDLTKIVKSKLHHQANYAVVILNRQINQNQEYITSLWNNALVRITVDGGTTKWDKFLSQLPEKVRNTIKMPDIVSGDFDSIGSVTLEKYKDAQNCQVIHTPDQMHTDFTKAIMELDKFIKLKGVDIDHVMVVCQSSGRLDQILGNIQTLFLIKERSLLCPTIGVYLLTEDAISWLLHPGNHVINIPEQSRCHKEAWCSLVPIGETCSIVTTTGLKWNLNNQSLKFGEIVSTSNTFDKSDIVTVKCSNRVLWSMIVPGVIGQWVQ